MASAATRSVYSAVVGGIGSHDRGHIHHRSGQYAAVHQRRRMGVCRPLGATRRHASEPWHGRSPPWRWPLFSVPRPAWSCWPYLWVGSQAGSASSSAQDGISFDLYRQLRSGSAALCSSARSAPLSGARSGSCKRSVSVSAHRRSPTSTSPCGNCRCSPSLEPDRSRTAPSLTSCSSRRRPQPPRQEHLAQDRARESSRPGPAHRRQPW